MEPVYGFNLFLIPSNGSSDLKVRRGEYPANK